MFCAILFCGRFLTAVAGHALAACRALSHAMALLTLTSRLHLMVSFEHHALSFIQTELKMCKMYNIALCVGKETYTKCNKNVAGGIEKVSKIHNKALWVG